jgi:hypothetical protein
VFDSMAAPSQLANSRQGISEDRSREIRYG